MLRVFLNAFAEKLEDALFKSRSVPACAVCINTKERFCLHMLRVFLNASLKNSGILCLNLGLSLFYVSFFLVIKKTPYIFHNLQKYNKIRSVPACAVCLHTNERFCLHMLRVFFNAVAKKLGDALF